jgi:hypothetical protein
MISSHNHLAFSHGTTSTFLVIPLTVNQMITANPEWGPGYLDRNLFQKYHLLVAYRIRYAKNGPKLEFGNVRRIVSQMRSGVAVLVEDRGYAHSSFIRKYSYSCKFTDDKSFQEMLERIRSWRILLRAGFRILDSLLAPQIRDLRAQDSRAAVLGLVFQSLEVAPQIRDLRAQDSRAAALGWVLQMQAVLQPVTLQL